MIHLRKTEGLKRRNILLFLTVMAFMFLISMNSLTVHAETSVVSGKCGDNLTYSLNLDTGALSITGSGMMNSSKHRVRRFCGMYKTGKHLDTGKCFIHRKQCVL